MAVDQRNISDSLNSFGNNNSSNSSGNNGKKKKKKRNVNETQSQMMSQFSMTSFSNPFSGVKDTFADQQNFMNGLQEQLNNSQQNFLGSNNSFSLNFDSLRGFKDELTQTQHIMDLANISALKFQESVKHIGQDSDIANLQHMNEMMLNVNNQIQSLIESTRKLSEELDSLKSKSNTEIVIKEVHEKVSKDSTDSSLGSMASSILPSLGGSLLGGGNNTNPSYDNSGGMSLPDFDLPETNNSRPSTTRRPTGGKFGKIGKMASKIGLFATKVASRAVPGVGWAMLAMDAAEVGGRMLNGQGFTEALLSTYGLEGLLNSDEDNSSNFNNAGVMASLTSGLLGNNRTNNHSINSNIRSPGRGRKITRRRGIRIPNGTSDMSSGGSFRNRIPPAGTNHDVSSGGPLRGNGGGLLEGITSNISGILDNFGGFSNILSTIGSGLKNIIGNVWNVLKNVGSKIFNVLGSIASGIWDTLTGIGRSIFNTVRNFVGTVWDTVMGGLREAASRVFEAIKTLINGLIDMAKQIGHMVVDTLKEVAFQPMMEAAEKWIEFRNAVGKEMSLTESQWSSMNSNLANMISADFHGKIGATELLQNAQKTVQMGIKDEKSVEEYTKTLTKLQLAIDIDSSEMQKLLEHTKRLGKEGSKSIEKLGRAIKALDNANLMKMMGNKNLMQFANAMAEIFDTGDPDDKAFLKSETEAMSVYNTLNTVDPRLAESYSKAIAEIANTAVGDRGKLTNKYGADVFRIGELIDRGEVKQASEIIISSMLTSAKNNVHDIGGEGGQWGSMGMDRVTRRKIKAMIDRGQISESSILAGINQNVSTMQEGMNQDGTNGTEDNLDKSIEGLNVGQLQELKNLNSAVGMGFGQMLYATGVNTKDINFAIDKIGQILSMGFSILTSVVSALIPSFIMQFGMMALGLYAAFRIIGKDVVVAGITGAINWAIDVLIDGLKGLGSYIVDRLLDFGKAVWSSLVENGGTLFGQLFDFYLEYANIDEIFSRCGERIRKLLKRCISRYWKRVNRKWCSFTYRNS